ncbi:MAG: hypothetical protein QM831_21105 [Kofleriaceae bacterium]
MPEPRGRKRALKRAAKLVTPDADRPREPSVTPLHCPECDAPLPLGDGATTICLHCKHEAPLPEEYRSLRDTETQRGADRDRAEQLYKELGSPPSPALRFWASFTTVAASAVFTTIIGIVTVFSAAFLLAGFALELVCHALAGVFGVDLIDRFGGGTVYTAFILIAVFGGLFPNWLVGYLDSLAQIKHSLQVNLAAIPPQKDGFPSTCRGCGAALDVPKGAYGVRCPYCEADNIVSLPREWLASATAKQATFHRSIVTAVEQANQIRAEMRAGWPTALKWVAGTALVFGLIGKGCSALDSESIDLTWKQSMATPRIMRSYWEPDKPIPIDQTLKLVHITYQVALRHHETLVWDSPDEGGKGTFVIHNTTSFPMLTREWVRPWDGKQATFTAPYTGIFVVKLNTGQPEDGKTHLRWSVR